MKKNLTIDRSDADERKANQEADASITIALFPIVRYGVNFEHPPFRLQFISLFLVPLLDYL